MNPLFPRLLRTAVLAGFTVPVAALAQGRFDNTAIPMQFLETSPWTISAGARFSADGANVAFGQLGQMRFSSNPVDLDESPALRSYDNGTIVEDAVRANERDAAGNVFTTPGSRYAGRQVDTVGNETYVGDFVAYDPDRTRSYSYESGGQVANGRLGLSLFGTQSGGATATSDKSASGGFEVNVGRRLMRLGRRVEVGVNGMFGLSDVNASTSQTITADLVRLTDYYRFYGTPPAAPSYSGPSFTNLIRNGQVVTGGLETTVAIDQTPFERQIDTIVGGATIMGSWKIKGAYYIVRIGPTIRIFVTDRLAFSFEGGLAGAFVGTTFEAIEVMELEGVGVEDPLTTAEQADTSKLLAGFYGAGAVEYWMTDRTNAYAGAAYESLDNYQQSVGGRTAEIDIGSTITVRMGLTTRF